MVTTWITNLPRVPMYVCVSTGQCPKVIYVIEALVFRVSGQDSETLKSP
jgi:hypothetical protein